jgi:hypothetical protein
MLAHFGGGGGALPADPVAHTVRGKDGAIFPITVPPEFWREAPAAWAEYSRGHHTSWIQAYSAWATARQPAPAPAAAMAAAAPPPAKRARVEPAPPAPRATPAEVAAAAARAAHRLQAAAPSFAPLTRPATNEERRLLPPARGAALVREACGAGASLARDARGALDALAADFVAAALAAGAAVARRRRAGAVGAADVALHLERAWGVTVPGFGAGVVRPYRRLAAGELHRARVAAGRRANAAAAPPAPGERAAPPPPAAPAGPPPRPEELAQRVADAVAAAAAGDMPDAGA